MPWSFDDNVCLHVDSAEFEEELDTRRMSRYDVVMETGAILQQLAKLLNKFQVLELRPEYVYVLFQKNISCKCLRYERYIDH